MRSGHGDVGRSSGRGVTGPVLPLTGPDRAVPYRAIRSPPPALGSAVVGEQIALGVRVLPGLIGM
ncbi:hypothetical protein, partial [Streptomyces lancefieldiae]